MTKAVCHDPSVSTETPRLGPLLATVIRLGTPSVLENALATGIILTDALMLAQLENNTVFLAATAITGVMYWRTVNVAGCTQFGAAAYVARRWGEERYEEAGRATGHAVLLTALIGMTVAALFTLLVIPSFRLMGAEGEVLVIGASYFRILLLALPIRLMLLSMTACMRSAGDTVTPLLMMVMMVVTNVFLNWLLIFGKLGFPRLEMDGAAIASAASFSIGALAAGWFLWRGLKPRRLVAQNIGLPVAQTTIDSDEPHSTYVDTSPHQGVLRFRRGALRLWVPGMTPSILRVTRPALGEEILYTTGFLAYLSMVGHFGAEVLAAHSATLRIEAFSFTAGFGVAVATGTMVGQALGARQVGLARRLFKLNAVLSMTIMGLFGIVFALFPDFLLGFFRLEGQALDIGRMIMYILALAQVFTASGMTLTGGLKGAGDTFATFVTQFGCVLGMRVGMGYLLAWPLGLGVTGIYWATVLDWMLRTVILGWFVARGGWEKVKV